MIRRMAQFLLQLVPTVLHLAHDAVVAGHPGRERTLTALRTHYFWPTMKIDVEKHVNRCVKCAQYKGVPSGPAPVQQYPPPSCPFDCVSIDLLQLLSPDGILYSFWSSKRHTASLYVIPETLVPAVLIWPRCLTRTSLRYAHITEATMTFHVNQCVTVRIKRENVRNLLRFLNILHTAVP